MTNSSLSVRHTETIPVFLVFVAFLVFMLAQHQLVFLYHDDYGVAVLDYPAPATAAQDGASRFLEICRFVWNMYMEWSGRVLSLLVMVLAHALGLEFLRVAQSLIIVVVVVLAVAAASRAAAARFEVLASLFAVGAFLTFPAGTLINGVYWFSASVHYLWFLPAFLAGVCIAARRERLTAGCVILLSAAALAQEQVALGAFTFAALFVLLVEARGATLALLKPLPILAAALVTILAPGNFARARAGAAGDDGGLMVGIQDNAELLAGQLFAPGHDKNYFAYVMLAALVLLAVHAARRGLVPRAWLTAAMAVVVAGLAALYQTGHIVLYMLLFATAYTSMLAAVAWRGPGRTVLAVHLAGIATLVPLLFSPAVAPRSAIPFFVLALVPAVYAFLLASGVLGGTVRVLLIALLGMKAVDNADYIYSGFRENARVLKVNDHRLRAAGLLQENDSAAVETVQLYKIPNPRFAEKMPYEKPVIGGWMKKYYGLDQRVELIWQAPE